MNYYHEANPPSHVEMCYLGRHAMKSELLLSIYQQNSSFCFSVGWCATGYSMFS